MSRPYGFKLSEETKHKISESHKKINHNWLKNIKRLLISGETRKKMSEAKKGKIPLCAGWNKGLRGIKTNNKGGIPWNKGKKLGPAWNKGKGKYPNGRDPEKIKVRLEKYQKLGWSALWLRNCRAKRKSVNGCFTKEEWEDLKKQYNFICPSCNKKEPEIRLSIDHIIPLSLGGSNKKDNIQPLCVPCNVSKHTKIIKYEYKT